MVRWTWWDWRLSLGLLLPSVLIWHCWLGHLTRKNPSPIWRIMCLVGRQTLLNQWTLFHMPAGWWNTTHSYNLSCIVTTAWLLSRHLIISVVLVWIRSCRQRLVASSLSSYWTSTATGLTLYQPRWVLFSFVFFMAALCNRAGYIYFHPVVCSFFLLLFCFPRLISTIADWMSTILAHMVWP